MVGVKEIHGISKKWNGLYFFQAIAILSTFNLIVFPTVVDDTTTHIINFILVNLPLLGVVSTFLYLVSSLNLIQNIIYSLSFRKYKNKFNKRHYLINEDIFKKHGYKNGKYMARDRVLLETWFLFLVLMKVNVIKYTALFQELSGISWLLWLSWIGLIIGFCLKARSIGRELLVVQLLFIVDIMMIRSSYHRELSGDKEIYDYKFEEKIVSDVNKDIELGAWKSALYKIKEIIDNLFVKIESKLKEINNIIDIPQSLRERFNIDEFRNGRSGISNETFSAMIEDGTLFKMIEKITRFSAIEYTWKNDKHISTYIGGQINNFLSHLPKLMKPGYQKTKLEDTNGDIQDFNKIFWVFSNSEYDKKFSIK
jgi:hypothetical protein